MEIGFSKYMKEEHKLLSKKEQSFRLYHDWVFDKVFGDVGLDDTTARLIRMTLFRVINSMLFSGEFSSLEYYRTCISRVRAPEGLLKGKVISRLENNREFIPLLIALTKFKDKLVRKAASDKINEIKFLTDDNDLPNTNGQGS